MNAETAILIYRATYLFVPLMLVAGFFVWRGRKWVRWTSLAALCVLAVLGWGRYVEPKTLVLKETDVALAGAKLSDPASLTVAVVGDMHIGVFRNGNEWARVAEKINARKPDLVLLVGDYGFLQGPSRAVEGMHAAGAIEAPTFAVMGNHDAGPSDRDITPILADAMQDVGIVPLQNDWKRVTVRGRTIVVAGLSELWAKQQDYSFGDKLPPGDPVILMAHNPDTAAYVPASLRFELLVSGHTHGGQVRMPFLGALWIPTDLPFDQGLYDFPGDLKAPEQWRWMVGADRPGLRDLRPRQVFVTPGVGMSHMPLRFLQQPQIDILNLRLPVASGLSSTPPSG